jgi:hypothetical protein
VYFMIYGPFRHGFFTETPATRVHYAIILQIDI